MLTTAQITENRDKIVMLLAGTNRANMDALLNYMLNGEFFLSPGSTRYHGCYAGGLAKHSLNVYDLLSSLNQLYQLACPQESVVIAALLHDLCKMGAYLGTCNPYTYNRSNPKGHAELSIQRVKQFISLTPLEDMMIRYHMGVYGLIEFDPEKGEYPLRGEAMAHAWHHFPIVKVMYFCDEFATLQEKCEENSCHTSDNVVQ